MRRLCALLALFVTAALASWWAWGGAPLAASADTPTPTPTATQEVVQSTITNSSGAVADTADVYSGGFIGVTVASNAPGCSAPSIVTAVEPPLLVQPFPQSPTLWSIPRMSAQLSWSSSCVDPGETVVLEYTRLALPPEAAALATLYYPAPIATFFVASVATPTPMATATPTPTVQTVTLTNTTGLAATDVDIYSTNFSSFSIISASGCPAGAVTTSPATVGFLGPLYVPYAGTKIHIAWPSFCIDPGDSISVQFTGLTPVPPMLYPTTSLPIAFFSAVQALLLDCDTSTAGIQSTCTFPADAGSIDVDVVYRNLTASSIAALQFEVRDPDTGILSPPVVNDPPYWFDGNPDFSEAGPGASGTWNCDLVPPLADTGGEAPPVAVSRLLCFVLGPNGPGIAPGSDTVLGTIHYSVTGTTGSVGLSFKEGVTGDNEGWELIHCAGPDLLIGPGDANMDTIPDELDGDPCLGATINIVEPPATSTVTPSPSPGTPSPPTVTPTPTPALPGVQKRPETCIPWPTASANCDPAIPAANLFLCLTGPCSGPGEGDLIVYEYASNIATGDNDSDTDQDGLGAYELDIEYDNLVIQSVNPEDIVFAPSGSVSPYPTGTDGITDGEGAARAPSTCNFSLVLENIIHFGCTTSGPIPDGPLGDLDLARLRLVPHPDLANDLFPGNDNGVVTVLKDNGCELVDVFGHPALGSVNGGLTPVCGDLAVTVRILEGDLNLDCAVDVTDEQLIAYRYGAFFGSALYGQWYDLEPNLHDLDIDIKDLQKVYGRDGSSCQQPFPSQPPQPPPAPFS